MTLKGQLGSVGMITIPVPLIPTSNYGTNPIIYIYKARKYNSNLTRMVEETHNLKSIKVRVY